MVCLGFEPGVAGWKALTNPLSYGGTPIDIYLGSQMLMDPLSNQQHAGLLTTTGRNQA